MKHQEVLPGPSEQLRSHMSSQFQKAIYSYTHLDANGEEKVRFRY